MISGRDVLLAERKGRVYIVTINREERRNAISMELMSRIDEEFQIFNEDADLYVLILSAQGDLAFCSGMDLKDLSDGPQQVTMPMPSRKPHPWVPTWKPTIAAVNGYAVAGGWWLAQRCDLRLAAEHATFGITEVNWNLPAPFAGESNVFPTSAIAAEITLMGRQISAQRAVRDRIRQQGRAERGSHGRGHGMGGAHLHARPRIGARP